MADNETTLGELKELISNTGQGVRGAISALLFELDQLIILDPGNTELIQLRLEGQDIFDNLGNFSRAISVAGFVSPALQGDFSGTIEGVNDFLVAEISEDLARRALDFINASTNAGALEGLTPNSRAVLDGFAGTIVEALGEGFANFVQNTVDTFANELRTALADEQNAAVAASFQAVNGLAEAFNNLEASGFEGHPLQGLLFEQVIRDTLILSLAVVDQLSSFSTFQAFLNNIFPVATIDEIVGNFVQIDSTNSVTVNVSLPSDISNAETPAVGAFAVNAVAVSINLAIENATDDHADVFSEAVGPSLERFGLVDDVQFVTLTNQNSFADFNATGQSLIFSGANTAIVGSDDADIILGSVFISGGGGDDTILVQQADTTATRLVNAGSGADLVIGSSDSDILNGDSGQDELFGGGGADQLSGGRGADILVGGEGQDTFFGGDQDDTLYHNNLDKEDDDDDVDRLEGGSGDDHYIVGNGDIISDDSSDGGSIHFNGIRLTGGTSSEDEATLSDDDRIYIGAEDETYERDGANLIVTLTSGEQLTIENYTSDGQHGITLTSEEEEPDVPDNFSSPLILDLDGDGIETTNLETGGVFFDIDNDGIRERTAFVAPDDGLLALDRNGDGLISDANELFGYGETISAFNQSDLLGPGGLDINFTSGFDRLRELDENSDGFIDTNDAAYADLVVWRDLDQDGRSDDGELFSLNDVGVAAISLADQTTRQFVNGNLLTDISSFVTTEGEVRQVGDVFFRFNQFDIDFDVPVNLDPAILDLPNLSGIGAVRDLHSSIATDQGLRELVEQFDQLGLDQLDEVSGLAEQIILRWHGVDADIATAFSRTPNANAAHVAVIESISDTPFRQSLSEGPRPQAGTVLEEQFEQYHRLITTRLLLQTELGQQLFPELSLIGTDFVILGDERDSSVILERLEANAPEAVLESLPYWHAALRVLDTVFGSFEDVDEVSYISNVEDLLARQGIDISYAELIVAYVGTQNDDGIIVSRGLGGRSLRDENGSDISSVIFGGGGDDVIRAGNGQQIIYYGEGQGNDTLQLPNFTPQSLGSEPTEVRIPDLELDDLSFQRGSDSPTDLTLTIVSTGETLTIQNAFNRATGAPAAVFVLDGGIRLDFEAALSLASSTGTSLSDIIIEGDFDSDQPLNGGAGNDLLVGQEGLTEFQFDIGSGQDVIQDADGDNVLIFGSGIGPGDLIFTMDPDNPNSLIISLIGDTNDSVTILGQFGQSPTIGEIRFVDGFPPITDFSLTAGNNVLQGTNQDDVLLSEELSTDDIIAGLEGNDLLQGRAGDDRYIFRNGDGQDIIEDSGQFGQVNTLVLVDSNLNDIQFSRTGDTDEDLLVIVGSGGDQVLIVDGLLASSSNSNRSIELIEFQDGSVITLAEITELIVQADINNGDQLVDGTFSDDVITLTEGDVTVFGNDGADIITTGGGNDAIFGGSGSDIIRAGQGDDIIQTGFGRDTILYSSGDGSDTITISSLIEVNGFNMDTLVFDDLSIGDIDVSRDGVDLLLTVQGNPSDSVLIVRQLAAFNSAFSNLNAAPLIETFEFADGSTLSFEDLRDLAFRSDATDGDDTIIGTSTIDRIFLSSGSDFLSGGSANDIYVRESGVTGDTIIDDDRFDGADRLVLEEFGPDDVTVSIADNGRDFVLTLPNGSVTLVDQRTSTSTSGIEIIEFADGTLWRQTDLTAAAISVSGLDGTLTGDSGDEIITGTAASETLDGGGGNDDLSGGAGSDLYLFGVGSGNDTINDNGANSFFDIDRVQLNGLNSSDVTFARQQNNSLIITIISTGETLTITDHFDSTSAGVEFILFADGSSLDREDLVEISAFIGTAGDDAFVGTDADELIDLGTGNDTIEARGGRNTLIFEVGDGNDFIDDRFTDNDNIVVLRGVNPADVLFDVTGSFLSNVTVRYGDGDSIEIESQLAGTGQVSEIRFDDGTIITREQILEQAIFRGTEASEAINGSSRDDVFDGGAGDDVITGQRGSDTYLWGVGSGSDIITDDSGDQSANSVQIIGLSLTDLEFSRDGRDLLITIASTGETLTVTDQFNATFSDFFGVGAVVFEDGTRLDRTQIAVLAPLIGTAASDTLIGDDSADAFLGGAGDDFIDGREGSDTYIWRLGDGNDTIDERFEQQDGDVDTILLQGLTAADITLSRDNLNNIEDLLITIDASGEQIRVLSQLDEFSSNVERILFDDGSEISLLNLGEILPIEGTDGSDFIEGTRSSDLILGRRGDDVLEGAEGDDTYLYRLGDGNDIIFENQGEANAGPSSDEGPSGFDTLRLEGITQDDIEITRLLPPTVIDGVLVFEGPQAFFDRVTFDFPVAFTGPVVFEDNADFFGPVTFDGPVTFLDFADFQDVATFNDTAVFERDATFNDFVEFGVSAVFEDDVSFTTSFSFGDADISFLRNVEANEPFTFFEDDQVFTEDVVFDGPVGFFGDVEFQGTATFNGAVEFQRDATFNGDAIINDAFSFDARDVTFNGDAIFCAPSDEDGESGDEDEMGAGGDPNFFFEPNNDLIINILSTGETITIRDYFLDERNEVERILLDDGTEIFLNQIASTLIAPATDNEDFVQGTSADDTLSGGLGNDFLSGGSGDDTYIIGLGTGDDTIDDSVGANRVVFEADISVFDVEFSRDGNDLIIEIGGLERTAVRVNNQFQSEAAIVSSFEFDDGTVITSAQVQAEILSQTSNDGNNIITGFVGDDIITARSGDDIIDLGDNRNDNDFVFGGEGRDTVIFQGSESDYTVEVLEGRIEVSHRFGDGTTTLVDVESIQFQQFGTVSDIDVVENIAPIAGELQLDGQEDQALIIRVTDLLSAVSDPDGSTLSVVDLSQFVGGIAELDGDLIRFVPDADFNGTASFQYTVADSDGALASDTVSIVLAAVNDAPIVVSSVGDESVSEDNFIDIQIPPTTFADVDGDALTFTASLADGSELPAWLSFNSDTVTFSGQPPADFNGVIELLVTAGDGLESASAAFAFIIDPVNDAPILAAQLEDFSSEAGEVFFLAIAEDTFTDIDADILTFTANLSDGSALPEWLIFDPSLSGFVGTPPTGVSGDFEIIVTASDGEFSVSDTFTITVTAGNEAPLVSAPVANQSFAEDTFVEFALPDDTFFDADGDELALTASLADGSALPAWLIFDSTTGTFSGQPPLNFNGDLELQVTASDGEFSATTAFTLAITAVNDGPTLLIPLSDQSGLEDTAVAFALPEDAFGDVEGDTLTLTAGLANGDPLPAWLIFDGQGFSGTPPQDFNGTLEITVTASDGELSTSDNFLLTIGAVNDAPAVGTVIEDQTGTEESAFFFELPADAFTDVDGDTLTLTASLVGGTALPVWLSFDGQTFSGTPPQDFNGALDIVVTATDGAFQASQLFTVTVNPVNDSPVIENALPDQAFEEDTPVSFTVPAETFSDVDSDALTLFATLVDGSPLPSWLVFDGEGFSGQPPENFNGDLQLRVTASDGELEVFSDFTLEITPVNDAVIAVDDVVDTNEDQPLTISILSLLENDFDLENNSFQLTAILAVTGGTAVLDGEGNIIFTPEPNFSGEASFTYEVTDLFGAVSQAVVTVNVASVNDAPELIMSLVDQTGPEDEFVSFAIPERTFADVEGDAITLTASLADGSELPDWLTFDGETFSGTPPQDFNGLLAVTVTASDGELTTSAAFNLEITPVNDAPTTLVSLPNQSINEDEPFSFAIDPNSFEDVDGDTLTLAARLANGEALPEWLSFDPESAVFSGTPPQDFNGSLAILVTASDGEFSTFSAFQLIVNNVNDAPIVSNELGVLQAVEDEAIFFALPEDAFFDVDGDALSLSARLASGEALPDTLRFEDGTLFGFPEENFNGTLDITVEATDGEATISQTFSIEVAAVNDAPIATADLGLEAFAGVDLLIDAETLLANDIDVDGDDLSILSISGGIGGQVSLTEEGDVLYTADEFFSGLDQFTYVLTDGEAVATGIVQLEVQNAFSDFDQGTDGNDVLFGDLFQQNNIFGADGDDFIVGGLGADRLFGGNGNDIIFGLFGSDELDGGSGNDRLIGGFGNDILRGGSGTDVIFGGAGSDEFIFRQGDGIDFIADFARGRSSFFFTIAGDRITIDVDGVDSFYDLLSYGEQIGRDTVFDFGEGDVLILNSTRLAALDDDVFTFV